MPTAPRTAEQKAARATEQRRYYRENRAARDSYTYSWKARKRIEVIEALGGRCACCGVSDPVVLNIDHVNGGGAEHRRATNRAVSALYRAVRSWLEEVKSGTTQELRYQLLCCNCNWRKEVMRRSARAHN